MKKMKIFLIFAALMAGFASVAIAKPIYTELLTISGNVERRGDNYFVQGMELQFGDNNLVAGDYDGDGQRVPVQYEVYKLVGKKVTIKGYRDDNRNDPIPEIYVTEINGKPFPNPKVKKQ